MFFGLTSIVTLHVFFSAKACLVSRSICFINAGLYGYRLTQYGATNKYHKGLYESYKRAIEEVKDFAKEHGQEDEFIKEADRYFTKRIPSFVRMAIRSGQSIRKQKERIRLVLKDEIIESVLQNDWDELIRGENKKNIEMYSLAKAGKINSLLFLIWKEEMHIKLAGYIKG